MTKETNNNRDNLITMIAISEDIYKTNNRIYELLRGLMANPHELTNIKKSIDNLYEKVTNLKNFDIKTPFVDEEKVIVPGTQDISPKQDVEYEKLFQQQSPSEPEEEVVVEEEEVEELVVEEPPRLPRKPRRNPRKNVRGRRPMKPLRERKTPSETDLQDQ